MSNDHKLIKQMDALTYNARSVLNALIRSVISASSTNGYRVKRSGVELVLSRPLIYRLYRFYQEWENNDFSTTTTSSNKSFDDILSNQDTVPVTDDSNNVLITNPTSKALITHSKILFLNSSNVSRNEDTSENNSYWIDLVKTSNNSKLIANSSPIPLNIRTPIFDENLSTTRFLSHESYLFPQSYFTLDQFGYSGDDRDHTLSGKGWTVDSDEYIYLNSKIVSLGSVNEQSILKTLGLRSGDYAVAWGYDTHARGFASTAGGVGSISTSDSSVAIGRYIMASGYASVAMGFLNTAAGVRSAVIGGYSNMAIASDSGIYAGANNITGGEAISFTFQVLSNGSESNCVVDLENCIATSVPGGNSIVISKNVLIVQGDSVNEFSPNDNLTLFNFTTLVSGVSGIPFYDVNGNGFESMNVVIVSVRLETQNGQPVTAIVIDRDVNYSNVDGGFLSITYKNTPDSSTSQQPGLNSFVTGLNNIASGSEQAVVGRYNKKVADALFLVGSGVGTQSRSNSLVVKSGEVTAYGLESISGILGDDAYAINVNPTSALLKAGLAYTQLTNGFIYNKAGLFDGNNFNISELEMNFGNSRFSAGSLLSLESRSELIIDSTNLTTIDSSLILITGNNVISLLSTNGDITTSSQNINLTWSNSLSLNGDTYPALPTTGSFGYRTGASSHFIGNAPYAIAPNDDLFNIRYTGFFTMDGTPPTDIISLGSIGAESTKFWLLNTTFVDPDDSNQAFESWQMIFGRQSSYSDGEQTTGNIGVRRVNNTGLIEKDTEWRYLAYLDEVIHAQSAVIQQADYRISGYGESNSLQVMGVGNTPLQTTASIVNGTFSVDNGNIILASGNAYFQTEGCGLIFNGKSVTVSPGITANFGSAVCGVLTITINGLTTFNYGSFTHIIQTNAYNPNTSMVFLQVRAIGLDRNFTTRVQPIAPGQFQIFFNDQSFSDASVISVYFFIVDSINAIL